MEPTTITSYEQARRLLLEARKIREQLERILQDFPISYGQFIALDVIVRHGPLESQAVAEKGWERVDYSRRIMELEEVSYVSRRLSSEDRRKKLVSATQPGKSLYYRIMDRIEQ